MDHVVCPWHSSRLFPSVKVYPRENLCPSIVLADLPSFLAPPALSHLHVPLSCSHGGVGSVNGPGYYYYIHE